MTPQLAFHATLASLALTLGVGIPLARRSSPELRPLLALAFLLELPMCALMAWVVRAPIDAQVKAAIPETSNLYLFVRTFYAPFTEEPGKLLPLLLVPALRRALERGTAVRIALALGVGFAVGEAWYVAAQLSRDPRVASLPLFASTGFTIERTLAAVAHSAFTATALVLATGPSRLRVLGFLAAATLHFAANSPIPLAKANAFGLAADAWGVIVPVVSLVSVAGLGALLVVYAVGLDGLRARARSARSARVRCPTCAAVYDRPVLGINLPERRYEACGACGRWQWIRPEHVLPLEAPGAPSPGDSAPPPAVPPV